MKKFITRTVVIPASASLNTTNPAAVAIPVEVASANKRRVGIAFQIPAANFLIVESPASIRVSGFLRPESGFSVDPQIGTFYPIQSKIYGFTYLGGVAAPFDVFIIEIIDEDVGSPL